MADINPGSTVRLTASFVNDSDVASDPTTVTVYVKAVGHNETAYVYGVDQGVVKDSTGVYHMDYVVPDIQGRNQLFAYRWTGEGTLIAAGEGEFTAITRFF